MPDGLERIGVSAFRGSGLEEVVFPTSLMSVSPSAFQLCRRLRSALLNEGLRSLGVREFVDREAYEGSVFEDTALESVHIPSTVETIGNDTFSQCAGLKTITLAEGLETIGGLWKSNVETMTLPRTLKFAVANTFWGCQHLGTVYVEDGCEACLYWAGVPETT